MLSWASQLNLEIVKRSDAAKTFKVLPKRLIVERTIGRLNRCRRLHAVANLTLPAQPVIADANRQLHHVLGLDPEICARRG